MTVNSSTRLCTFVHLLMAQKGIGEAKLGERFNRGQRKKLSLTVLHTK